MRSAAVPVRNDAAPYDVVLIVADAYRKDNAERAAQRRIAPMAGFGRDLVPAVWLGSVDIAFL
jgi:hypothetical protein